MISKTFHDAICTIALCLLQRAMWVQITNMQSSAEEATPKHHLYLQRMEAENFLEENELVTPDIPDTELT